MWGIPGFKWVIGEYEDLESLAKPIYDGNTSIRPIPAQESRDDRWGPEQQWEFYKDMQRGER